VGQEQKERFAAVMEKTCNHDLKENFFSICSKAVVPLADASGAGS
jgi:hypothetical protein